MRTLLFRLALAASLLFSAPALLAQASSLLPPPSADIEYIAKSGDTMIGIARRYLIEGQKHEVQRALWEHNQLKDKDRINPGHVVRIPGNWVKNEAGRIELAHVEGDARSGGQPLRKGATLSAGDELKTGKDGYVTIKLADGFEMRQVSRRRGDHQTQIVTTRRDLPVTEVAQRMFNRWCQENFFKYMREQYAIDALVEYGHEFAEPEREMPNPEWRKLDKLLRKAKTKAMKLEARYGAAALDKDTKEGPEPAQRRPKSAPQADLLVPLHEARGEVARLLEERDKHPRRVTVGQAKGEAPVCPAAASDSATASRCWPTRRRPTSSAPSPPTTSAASMRVAVSSPPPCKAPVTSTSLMTNCASPLPPRAARIALAPSPSYASSSVPPRHDSPAPTCASATQSNQCRQMCGAQDSTRGMSGVLESDGNVPRPEIQVVRQGLRRWVPILRAGLDRSISGAGVARLVRFECA